MCCNFVVDRCFAFTAIKVKSKEPRVANHKAKKDTVAKTIVAKTKAKERPSPNITKMTLSKKGQHDLKLVMSVPL